MVSKNRGIYRVLSLSQVLIIMVPRNTVVCTNTPPSLSTKKASGRLCIPGVSHGASGYIRSNEGLIWCVKTGVYTKYQVWLFGSIVRPDYNGPQK